MKSQFITHTSLLRFFVALLAFLAVFSVLIVSLVTQRASADTERTGQAVLLTIHDRGVEQVIVTRTGTIAEALDEANIELATQDVVEPALNQELVNDEYSVNIYRARPVTVVDGNVRQKVMTAYQTPERIAQQVGITLYAEDKTEVTQSSNLLRDGAGLELRITRAVSFTFTLFGGTSEARTQGKTVGEMLREKNITLSAADRVVPDIATPITAGMEVRVWREGRQTVTVDEPVDFEVDQIRDANQPIGYKVVQTAGVLGSRTVTYDIETQNGVEVSRVEIASIAKTPSQKQVEIIGIKNSGGGLTKSMGVKMFTDSNGVTHRETYYDLPMSLVMRNCGQAGYYTVRADGVKVDAQGYVIVAAHLGRYPRCSVVETSLGPGKVYDTGGFAAVHPDGFDLATDWTNNNGI